MFLYEIIMIDEGGKVKIKPKHLVSTLRERLRTIYFNLQLIDKLFQIIFANLAYNFVSFFYQGVMKELPDIPCSTFK